MKSLLVFPTLRIQISFLTSLTLKISLHSCPNPLKPTKIYGMASVKLLLPQMEQF